MRIFLVFVIAILASPVLAQGRITVVGQGMVAGVPDMATVFMGISVEEKTSEKALDAVSAAVDKMTGTLGRFDIAARDIQTSGLNLSPRWNNSSSSSDARLVGYFASISLSVRVRDLDRLGRILDAVVTSGANQFHGLEFGLQNPGPALDEARRMAVRDARRKAELYAEAAGVGLGTVLSISEPSAPEAGPVMMRETAALVLDAVPVSEGEVSTNAAITIVFEILP